MNYDLKKIGSRIKKCRKEYRNDNYHSGKALDQESFATEILFCNRKTLSSWENGHTLPSLDMMLKMCDLFNCELGYLLCEYDTKTRIAADIQEETGLSEEAINNLLSEKRKNPEDNIISNLENRKLSLIDRFIIDCDPIVSALYELSSDALKKQAANSLYPNRAAIESEIFAELFVTDCPEHLKPQMFIDEAIKQIDHGWCGEEVFESQEELQEHQTMQRDSYYEDYMRLMDEVKYDKQAMYRHNMDLVFNQIIDKILSLYEDEMVIFAQDIAREVGIVKHEEGWDYENGKHEEK